MSRYADWGLHTLPWVLGALSISLATAAAVNTGRGSVEPHPKPHSHLLAAATTPQPDQQFETITRKPSGPPRIELSNEDPQGRSGTVACSTCHSVKPPNRATRTAADLDQFHQHLRIAHGTLGCYACHNPNDADTLRLADDTTVEYSDVMTLCGQCHGPQARDYEHGGHGGMTGYWDLRRGPRQRNNCIDCHDPHAPKFPTMIPTFKPRDRFLDHSDSGAAHSQEAKG